MATWIELCRAYHDDSLLLAQGLALHAGSEEGRLAAVVISAIALAAAASSKLMLCRAIDSDLIPRTKG
jgi:hypothetical protein